MRSRAVLSVLSIAAIAASRTVMADNFAYSIRNISLTGVMAGNPGVTFTGTNGTQNVESSSFALSNGAGFVLGSATEYTTGTSTSVGTAAWLYNPLTQTTVEVGLNGPAYTGSSRLTTSPNILTALLSLSATGYVAGTSPVVAPGGGTAGVDTWVYNPTSNTTVAIPLPTPFASDPAGTNYTPTYNGILYHNDDTLSAVGVSNSGQVVGSILRFGSGNSFLGSDAWYYNGSSSFAIGLTGSAYTNSSGARYNNVLSMNANGEVLGSTYIYNGTSSNAGTDVWLYLPAGTAGGGSASGNTTLTLQLPASTITSTADGDPVTTSIAYTNSYTGARFSSSIGMDALGRVAATSIRWVYNAYDDAYDQSSGIETWIYNPLANGGAGGYGIVGLQGPGNVDPNNGYGTSNSFASTSALVALATNPAMNSAGYAIGQATSYSSLTVADGSANGSDAWVYVPSSNPAAFGTTIKITLTDPTHITAYAFAGGEANQNYIPQILSASGQVAGTAARFDPTNTTNNNAPSLGVDTWYYDPNRGVTGIAVRVGLIGGVYEQAPPAGGSIGIRNSSITAINATGDVAGISLRYKSGTSTSLGQDAWVAVTSVNSNGNLTATTIDMFPAVSASTYFYSTITALSDSGVAVGYYTTSSSPTVASYTAFAWTAVTGEFDLDLKVSPTLSAATWLDIAESMQVSNLGTIVAISQLTTDASGSQSVVILKSLLDGDANGDGTVDVNDLNIVLNNLGTTTSLWANGNFDGAPTIDLTDLNDVLNNLGTSAAPGTAGSGSTSAVPEPASFSIATIGGLLLLRRRRPSRD